MFEQVFKNIDDILWKEGGCSNELDYVEQTSWILFLKYLDNLESEREDEAALRGDDYERIIEKKFRWETWAAPKTSKGEPDHNKAMTGDDLIDFVNEKLFPYLKKFKEKASTAASLEYKIGEIFGELKNKITSGYNLREILWYADKLSFQSSEEKHEMSHLYEDKIHRMGNAGRNGGEYYTPRPLIRTIVKVVDPKIGETVYDAACGSAGFLCEAYAYMKEKVKNVSQKETLQASTYYGKEKKGLAYIIGIMNMMLTTVTERTMEIGLKKALGARQWQIQTQFLIESFLLSVIGGCAGILFGLLLSLILCNVTGTTFALSVDAILLGFGFSAAIGILFGWAPARKASKLNPIDALRSM